jgi:hypothetical protein
MRKKKKQQQQQLHILRGARGQLQKRVWDPGGFQHWVRGAHEQELMFFLAGEYDARASLHLSSAQAFHHIISYFMRKRGIEPLTF